MVGDGGAGAYIACAAGNEQGYELKYYVQRFTFAGTVAPGWPVGGVLVCAAPGDRFGLRAAADGLGGILLTWWDYRDFYSGGDIYALRVLPDGSIAPGWTTDGVQVTANEDGVRFDSAIAPDGQGGSYLAWTHETSYDNLRFQHLTPQGAVAFGWPPNGIGVGTSLSQTRPQIISDGKSGAIVTWEEPGGPYAQRFVADGVVPVLLSLVNADAEAGRVRLTWYGAEAAGLSATVYRRTQASDWERRCSVSADGTGHVRFEDREVSPGERYAYRLRYLEAGAELFTAETWVEVPAATPLTLEGLRPNPAAGELRVWFTLPSAELASLELLDVTGRRLAQREVGALGAGGHLLRLEEARSLVPGIYWLRLRQGGRTLLARGVVVR
jgi:hypothetical protein